MTNPFYCCSRINNPEYFVGREKEVGRIFSALEITHTGQMQSISVVGPRRMGRSSLLYHICQTYAGHLGQSPRYIFHYVDLLSAQNSSLSGLLNGILVGLAPGVPEEARSLRRELRQDERNSELTLPEFAEAIQKFQTVPKQPLFPVVCLDEFEQLTKYRDVFPRRLYDGWRSLINSGYIAFVIASTRPLYELADEELLTSPFFNIFSEYITLGDLTESEAYRLAEKGRKCNRHFDDDDVQRVLDWGGCHPLKLQQAGRAIYSAKAEANVNWQQVHKEYKNSLRQTFGQPAFGQRVGRGWWQIAETAGATVLFWKGTDTVDRRVYRTIGTLVLLFLAAAFILLFVFPSPMFRSWVEARLGVPTPTPVLPTLTPTP